ncbi:hypothetical protein [Streptomyces sp. NPDC021139]|uniref:hypothetical protein n=1 Tax=Streptomyces sp. NPDC021139 TaxID=3154899 RepID=UPI0018E38A2D
MGGHGEPPQSLPQRHGLVRRLHHAHTGEGRQEPGQAGLDEGDAAGAGHHRQDLARLPWVT